MNIRPAILLLFLLSCQNLAFSQQKEYARKVVERLASPAFKGRGYVGNGDKIAADYIAAEFKAAGLLPLNKGSYYQEFELPVNTFPGRVEVKLDNQVLRTAADYLVDAGSPSVQGSFPVIPVQRADLNTLDKLLSLALRAGDAFILLDNRPNPNEDAATKALINKHVDALKYAVDLDFKGLLLYTEDKLTWTTSTVQIKRPVIIINKKDLDPATISKITLAIDAEFIPAYNTRNVIGMVKGTSLSDSTQVITAHYDHLGMLGKNVYFPGANDNASGVAMLLSFARHYSKHPPRYNTVFMAFSGEEIGILGSQAYVNAPLTDLSKIRFLVNFDLAGTGEEGIKVVNGSIFKDKFDLLVKLNDEHKLLKKVDIRGEACNSDHCRFHAKGVPSFFIYTQGGISAYHDIYDKAETLPLTAFDNYFRLMREFFDCVIY